MSLFLGYSLNGKQYLCFDSGVFMDDEITESATKETNHKGFLTMVKGGRGEEALLVGVAGDLAANQTLKHFLKPPLCATNDPYEYIVEDLGGVINRLLEKHYECRNDDNYIRVLIGFRGKWYSSHHDHYFLPIPVFGDFVAMGAGEYAARTLYGWIFNHDPERLRKPEIILPMMLEQVALSSPWVCLPSFTLIANVGNSRDENDG